MEPLSGARLFGLTSLNLAYGFMLSNQGLLLAPLEAERLFPAATSIGLAGLAICCGLGQLIGPAAGRWSDQRRVAKGRRTPTMLHASIGVVLLTCLLPLLSAYRLGAAFMFAFFLQQLAWIALYTVQAALVPDLVPVEQRSTAGGMAAALMLTGALGGLLAVRFVGAKHDYNHYAFGVGLTMLSTPVVCAAAAGKEAEQRREATAPAVASPPTEEVGEVSDGWLRDLWSSYKFKPARHPEFAKVLLYKMLYSASVMVKGFLLYFVQDTFRLNNLDAEQSIVGNAAVAAEGTAALAAIVVSLVFNRQKAPELPVAAEAAPAEGQGHTGVAPARRAGRAGTTWMALFWLAPPVIGYGAMRQFQASPLDAEAVASVWVPWMVAGTATWGIGQGFYLAADQALGYALIPDPNEASRFMGLMSVVTAVGAVGGGIVAGGLLYVFGGFGEGGIPSDGPGYSFPGYAAMFFSAVCLNVGCYLVIAAIRVGPTSRECSPIRQ